MSSDLLPPLPTLPITSQETLQKCRELDCSTAQRLPTIFICSFPKSGTTWMQNIIFQLLSAHRRSSSSNNNTANNNVDDAEPQQEQQEEELSLQHISQYAPFYEIDEHWEKSSHQLVSKIRTAHDALGYRIFNTHLRFDMLPQPATTTTTNVGNDNVKYIYVVRDGRDVLTSFYHHMTNQHPDDGGFDGDFETFFQQFIDGTIAYGKWSHHLISWIPTILSFPGTSDNGTINNKKNVHTHKFKSNNKFLLVRYEDLKENLKEQVIKIAKFLELDDIVNDYSNNNNKNPILDRVIDRVSFTWMREHQELFHPISVRWKPGYHFIRCGRAGDHNNIFNEGHKKIFMESVLSDFGGTKDELPNWLNEYCFHN